VKSTDTMPEISIHINNCIDEIDASVWNKLSAGQPFQSHNWYQYGEKVLDDCEPLYITAYRDEEIVGRASFWLTRNEPLPQFAGYWKTLLKPILRKWPLLICRSPLSSAPGIVILSDEDQTKVMLAVLDEAIRQAHGRKCSVLMFDFLSKAEAKNWPERFSVLEFPDTGTIMENRWLGFDDYLAKGDPKNRKNYRRTMRASAKFKVNVQTSVTEEEIEMFLPLVNNMEKIYGSSLNPWMGNMHRYMEMVSGQVVTVRTGGELAACGLLLHDNDVQLTTAFGRASDAPFIYMAVIYESLELAFERKVKAFRWGSGAYDLKKKLGFEVEDNGVFVYYPIQPILKLLAGWFS